MEVASLECKLAQVQLQRYLEGGPMSTEAVRALEEHLTTCPSCRATLEAEAPEPQPAPIPETPRTHAVVETPAPTAESKAPEPKAPVLKALVDKIPGRFRTLTLSIALAACLIAMSTFAKDPTQLLGPRASALPEKVVASEVVESPKLHEAIELERKALTGNTAKASPVKSAQPKVADPKPATPEPKVNLAPAARPAVTKPKARTVRRPVTRRVTTPRRAPVTRPRQAQPAPRRSSGIAVYDSNGNRIR